MRKQQVCICHKDLKQHNEKHPGRFRQSLSLSLNSLDHRKHLKSDQGGPNRWSVTRSKVSCLVQVQNCRLFAATFCSNYHTRESLGLLTQRVWLLSISHLIAGKPLKRLTERAGLHIIHFSVTESQPHQPQSTCVCRQITRDVYKERLN